MKAFVCLATMLIAMKYNLLIRFGRAFGRGMVFGHVSTLRPLNYSVTFSDSFHHQYFIFFFFFFTHLCMRFSSTAIQRHSHDNRRTNIVSNRTAARNECSSAIIAIWTH